MRLFAPLLVVVLAASAFAQPVPKGVAYVRAKDAINDKAQAEESSKLSAESLRALERELKQVTTPDPRELIAFQLMVQLWGGPSKGKDAFPSVPAAWRREVQRTKKQLEVEEVVEKVW
jgi:hypothetical protein